MPFDHGCSETLAAFLLFLSASVLEYRRRFSMTQPACLSSVKVRFSSSAVLFFPPLLLQRFCPCLTISGCVLAPLAAVFFGRCFFFIGRPAMSVGLGGDFSPFPRSSLSLFLSAIVLRLLLSLGPGSHCSVSVLGGGPWGIGFSSRLLC